MSPRKRPKKSSVDRTTGSQFLWLRSHFYLVVGLGLVALVLAVYGQMARGVFPFWEGEQFKFIHLDDGDYFFQNPHIKQGLTWDAVRWAFGENFSANWHPLTWLSLALDCEVYGLYPGGPHVTNLLLHLGSVLLLFTVFGRMTGQLGASAFVAALFAVHPLHAESVAWVSERKDVLCTFFALLALLAYERYARTPSIGRYLLVVAAYALSLLSKQMWVTFPGVLLLLDYWPLKRFPVEGLPGKPSEYSQPGLKRLLIEKLPIFGLAIGFAAMIFIVQKEAGAVASLDHISYGRRLSNVVISYWMYIYKTFWPTRLGVMYPHPLAGHPWTAAVAAAVPLMVILVLSIWGWRKWPWMLVGWLWYFGTLLPVIGLVQIGGQSWADRYAYVPHIGMFMALVWSAIAVLHWLQHRLRLSSRMVAYGGGFAAAAIVVALTIRGHQQVSLWKDTEQLFGHTVAVTENNYGMLTTLAGYMAGIDKLDDAKKYYKQALLMNMGSPEALTGCAATIINNNGDLDEAIELLERAHKIAPKDSMTLVQLGLAKVRKRKIDEGIKLIEEAPKHSKKKLPMVSVALGIAESQRGNLQKAEEHFRAALAIDPTDSSHLNVLGSFYLGRGEFDKAERQFRTALYYSPDDLAAKLDLGTLAIQKGRIEDAVKMFEAAVKERPGNADAHNRLAGGYMAQGKVAEAMIEFETAIRLRADWAPPLNDLAWTLATDGSALVRSGPRAVQLAEKACELTHHEDPAMLDTLAAAYAEAGRWGDAVKTAVEAKDLALRNQNEYLVAQIESQLTFFRQRRPFRASSRFAAESVREQPVLGTSSAART